MEGTSLVTMSGDQMSTALTGDDIGELSLMVKAKAMMEIRATVRSRVQTQFLNGQALAQAKQSRRQLAIITSFW